MCIFFADGLDMRPIYGVELYDLLNFKSTVLYFVTSNVIQFIFYFAWS